jgi:hypothetical protein
MDARSPLLAAAALVLALGLTVALLPRPEESEGADRAGSPDEVPLAVLARAEGVPAPAWRVGDAWTVRFSPSGFECTLVVFAANRSAALQGASCEGAGSLAAEDAVFDHAFLGAFTDELAGVQQDADPVRFFAWPLVDGKDWTLTWDGVPYRANATYDDALPAPDGARPGFRVVLTRDGEFAATYDYLPSLGWWSRLETASGFRMEVTAFTRGWSGTVLDGTAAQRLFTSSPGGTGVPVGMFPLGDDDHLVVLTHEFQGIGAGRLHVTTPSGRDAYQAGMASLTGDSRIVFLAGEPGTWRVLSPLVATGRIALHVYAIQLTPHEVAALTGDAPAPSAQAPRGPTGAGAPPPPRTPSAR